MLVPTRNFVCEQLCTQQFAGCSQVEESEREVTSVRALLGSADEALTARDGVVAALKAREATLAEKVDAAQV